MNAYSNICYQNSICLNSRSIPISAGLKLQACFCTELFRLMSYLTFSVYKVTGRTYKMRKEWAWWIGITIENIKKNECTLERRKTLKQLLKIIKQIWTNSICLIKSISWFSMIQKSRLWSHLILTGNHRAQSWRLIEKAFLSKLIVV